MQSAKGEHLNLGCAASRQPSTPGVYQNFSAPGVGSVSHVGSSSAASAVNCDGCSIFSGLGFGRGLRCGLLVGHVGWHVLLFGCPVGAG
jgi:hypothetical protein